jgi:LysR family hydrogen peroxide-inducible transcriptional activator
MIETTLRQLRYFDALAGHSHFGRAAAACGISQPALSMQIKDLEEALGAVLIERGARQVRLTKFGEDAALRVRDILRSVDELGDFARASRGWLAGQLHIGMIPTIAPYLLPTVIGNLTRMHPELDIHVRGTVFAIKLCRSAICNRRRRAMRWTRARYLHLSKWSAPAWV